MNFDNIVYSKPFDASGVKIDISSTDLTTSSRNIFCMGQDCCTGNTVWNPNVLKCDISCPRPDQPENKLNQNGSCVKECSGTYTEDASGKFCNIVQGFTNRPSSMANPYYSSEYDEYGRY